MTRQWTINGSLTVLRAADRTELLAAPVAAAVPAGPGIAEIDPELADTAAFCEHYGVPLAASANCVIVAGRRGGDTGYAACLALATTRINVNTVVRKRMGARKASFAPMADAVELTGMEYGGITPVGLPADWPILIDTAVAAAEELVIGSGLRGSKLFVSGAELVALPGAEVVEGLATPV